jgi:parallel beta-helix repeat protein
MNRKLVLVLALTLLIGMSNVAFNVQKAEASGTVYIRADGSIDPSYAPVSTVDYVTYTLTGNVTCDADGIVLERSNTIIDGNGYTLQGSINGNGFRLSNVTGVIIRNAKIVGFSLGITIGWADSNITIADNVIIDNNYGIYINSAWNNTIKNNVITYNHYQGVDIVHAYDEPGNIVENNLIANNDFEGIYIYDTTMNTIVTNNTVMNNLNGIFLDYARGFGDPGNNLIVHNNIMNNTFGIKSELSEGNKIYHNNMINNTAQVQSNRSTNSWDDGYPSGGNHWSNYTGIDMNSGLYQNETSSDGIGDAAYTIDANNIDHYPLVGMFQSYDVTYYTLPLVAHSCNVTVISNSTVSNFASLIWIEHPEVIMIEFNVTGEQGTTGFCRVSFPTAMMNGTYHVFVNGTEVPYILLPCSNADYSHLYFTYTHSTEGVIIIPEFPSFLILPLLMIPTLLAVIFYRRRMEAEN